MKHRKHSRYLLRAPVIFRWDEPGNMSRQGTGFTRDVSAGGLFISCTSPPPEGAHLALEVLLPPLEVNTQGLPLPAEGQVVRVQVRGSQTGFAVACELASADLVYRQELG